MAQYKFWHVILFFTKKIHEHLYVLYSERNFSYGFSNMCEKRVSNLDFYHTQVSKVGSTIVELFGIFYD